MSAPEQQYRRCIRDLGGYFFERSENGVVIGESVAVIIDRLVPRNPPQGMSFEQARALVNELLEQDPRAADLIAGLLVRSVTGEAAYLEVARNRDGGFGRKRIPLETRRAIIRADKDLKRDGMASKGDRTRELAKRFAPISESSIRRITPKLARGRPRKTTDKP